MTIKKINMEDDFYKKADEMFKTKLSYNEKVCIRVKDLKENKILDNMDYTRVRFDNNLNMYKLQNDQWIKVENENFKPVIVIE